MKYWQLRSNRYNKIDWVTDKEWMNKFLDFCKLNRKDIVLDAGCGTGIIVKELVNKVKSIVALDYSWDMLSQIQEEDIIAMRMDLEQSPIFISAFDKIISRMVFHHIKNLPKTFCNCHSMLKKDGWFIIQEGISPSNSKTVIDWTTALRNIKEKRQHFTKSLLVSLFKESGFKNISYKKIINKEFSIKNWLDNSWKNSSFSMYQKIYNAHLEAPEAIKKAYNMKILKNDIIIEAVSIIVKGQK